MNKSIKGFKQEDISDFIGRNNSLLLRNHSSLNEQNSFNKIFQENKIKKLFQVFHKKEIIIHEPNSSKKFSIKNSRHVIYKCIYCGNKFNTINRFESHMKIHVSLNKYNLYYYRLEKNHLNVNFVTKLLQKKEI